MWKATLLLLIACHAGIDDQDDGANDATDPQHMRVEFDIRHALDVEVAPTRTQSEALDRLRGVTVRWSLPYGVPRLLVRHGGYLSERGTDPKAFLRAHQLLFGATARDIDNLVLVNEYETRHNGARHVFFQQEDAGRLVFGSLVKITLDRERRIVIMGGAFFPRASATDAVVVTAEEAQALATRDNGGRVVATELVTFPMPAGYDARLAWKTLVKAGSQWFEIVVDAVSGELVYRHRLGGHRAPEGTVHVIQNPVLGGRQVVSFTGPAFDNAGWVTDRTTSGNNVNAYQDLDNNDLADYQPQTPAAGDPAYQHFNYAFTDAFSTSGGTDWTTDRNAAVTQAFYRANVLHDYFYALGFDEAAGNFQEDNFGRGGVAGDAMYVEIHNGVSTTVENSNTHTPPSQRPRLELGITVFTQTDGTTYAADHAMDAEVLTHEYMHGVSNRLVVGEVPGGDLPFGIQTWALGEGWSDFFGTSIYDDPMAGEYVCGNWVTGCPLFRYDNTPLVYSDLCTNAATSNGCEPHRDGEIWTAPLWDLRAVLGKNVTEQLVIDGIKNTTPDAATFLDARDGLLAADMTNGGAHQCLIWTAFAAREMGVNATTSAGQGSVTADTTVPTGCAPIADPGGPYTTTEGTEKQLDGSGSSVGSAASAAAIVTYEWDLDDDGLYDDGTGTAPSFFRVGQDGVYPVHLRVTDALGLVHTASTTITVTNVGPSPNVIVGTAALEGGAIAISGSGSDPGWLDHLTATVDWGDGTGPQFLPGTLENFKPNATLTFTGNHTYGDNGTFAVTICIADDDASTCATTYAAISNVKPTVTIGSTGQSTYGGVQAFVIDAGGSASVSATVTDPGSDDLSLTWDWADGPDTVQVMLVNPPASDPANSPSVQPRNLTASATHTFANACQYGIEVRAVDDDGGTQSATATVIVVGSATTMRGAGWWYNAYRLGPPENYSEQTLDCYLDVAVTMSIAFNTPLDRANALGVLFVKQNKGTAAELLDQQLLAAWLNFADGVIGLGDPVDTTGDGVNDSTFGAAMLAAEKVRTSATATRKQLLAQKLIIERIALRDE